MCPYDRQPTVTSVHTLPYLYLTLPYLTLPYSYCLFIPYNILSTTYFNALIYFNPGQLRIGILRIWWLRYSHPLACMSFLKHMFHQTSPSFLGLIIEFAPLIISFSIARLRDSSPSPLMSLKTLNLNKSRSQHCPPERVAQVLDASKGRTIVVQ